MSMTCFGTYISWNFIDSSIPDKSYVLLYAHSDLLGYDVWLNTGTYDCQYNRGSGNLGWYGGTRSDVENCIFSIIITNSSFIRS